MHASNDHESELLSWSMLNPLAVTEVLYDIIFRQAVDKTVLQQLIIQQLQHKLDQVKLNTVAADVWKNK